MRPTVGQRASSTPARSRKPQKVLVFSGNSGSQPTDIAGTTTTSTGSASSSNQPVEVLSGHPDAVRRRMEAMARQKKREQERHKQSYLEAMGMRWFEGEAPPNMFQCRSPSEYKALIVRASEEGKLLVAKFFTENCYVCKSLYPKMKRIAADNPDVLWVKLNGSDPNLAPLFEAMDIKKVPYFHFVLDGQLVSEMSASLSPEKLSLFRAELAAHKPQPPNAAAVIVRDLGTEYARMEAF